MTTKIDKKMWEIYPEHWKTESAYMAWIRGGLRRYLWSKNPVKLDFIRENRVKIPNPNPKGKVKEVWGGKCALTGEYFLLKDMDCDHKEGNYSLRSMDDLLSFFEGIVMVRKEDLQLVSKEAHKIKNYAEKQGITFEEAKAEKTAIALIQKKKDKEWLVDKGIAPESTQNKRREQIVKQLLCN